MDQEIEPDRSLISSLPDDILIEIISYLSVKKATATSLLSMRWRNLYRQMKNIVINESEFVKIKRVSFVLQMLKWVSRLSIEVIESFVLHIPKPKDSEASINFLIRFAVKKRVKHLVLDFSDPVWETSDLDENNQFLINLPDCVYNQTNIESLKLYACGINSARFKNSTALRSFTIGLVQISDVTTLLSKFPSLESLRFINCASLRDEEMVFGENQNRLRELVFKDCDFADPVCKFDIPKAVIFKYSGTVPYFYFQRVNEQMQEAYIEFDLETTYTIGTGEILACLVRHLSYAKTLTVCSYLLQMIQNVEDEDLQRRFETRHLVMRTSLHPYEFIGIRYLINNCPDLESLTFEMVPSRTMKMLLFPIEIEPSKYWLYQISLECLERTLKVVEVKGFGGGWFELRVVQYLIRYGRVMERLNLYVDEAQRNSALVGADMVQKIKKSFEPFTDYNYRKQRLKPLFESTLECF